MSSSYGSVSGDKPTAEQMDEVYAAIGRGSTYSVAMMPLSDASRIRVRTVGPVPAYPRDLIEVPIVVSLARVKSVGKGYTGGTLQPGELQYDERTFTLRYLRSRGDMLELLVKPLINLPEGGLPWDLWLRFPTKTTDVLVATLSNTPL